MRFKIFMSSIILHLNKYLNLVNDQGSLYESFSLVYDKTAASSCPVNFLNDLRKLYEKKVFFFT